MEVGMHRTLSAAIIFATALATLTATVVAEKGPTGLEMETYYVGLIFRGPTWIPGETPELMALQKAHLANITRLAKKYDITTAQDYVLVCSDVSSLPFKCDRSKAMASHDDAGNPLDCL
jgi:hypothetical protein